MVKKWLSSMLAAVCLGSFVLLSPGMAYADGENDMSADEIEAKEKAENVMTALLKLYLSDGFISKSEYVQAKVNLDSMTLGKIMNQMEVSERAISLLMENIEMGDINPKLFDALGNLQRTFIDLVKTQTNYVATAE